MPRWDNDDSKIILGWIVIESLQCFATTSLYLHIATDQSQELDS